MKNKKALLIRVAAVLVLIAIAAVMMVIGRGHTVYFDNKKLEYDGKTYDTPYKVVVFVKGEQVAKLYNGERGMSTWIGQNFKAELEITEVKGGEEVKRTLEVELPYNMDGIILNLPALLAELPEEAYLTEFIATPTEAEMEEEETPTDEFGISTEEFGIGEEPVAQ